MKAVLLGEFDAAENLRGLNIDILEPRLNEVLIKAKACDVIEASRLLGSCAVTQSSKSMAGYVGGSSDLIY